MEGRPCPMDVTGSSPLPAYDTLGPPPFKRQDDPTPLSLRERGGREGTAPNAGGLVCSPMAIPNT
jgi:hypothetical protein